MSRSHNNFIVKLQDKMNKIGTEIQNILREKGQNSELSLFYNEQQIFGFHQMNNLLFDKNDEDTESRSDNDSDDSCDSESDINKYENAW
jgi:hypothetical protein